MRIPSNLFAIVATSLTLGALGCGAVEPSDDDVRGSTADAIARTWTVERRAAGEDVASIAVTTEGDAYVAIAAANAPRLRVLAKQHDRWSAVDVNWNSPFVAASAHLVADGDDVIASAGEFYHVEIVRIHLGRTTRLLANSFSSAPALARSGAGRTGILTAGVFRDLVDADREVETSAAAVAFDGETPVVAGDGIARIADGELVTEVAAREDQRFASIWIDPSGAGVAVGGEGLVYQRPSSAHAWTAATTGVTSDLHAVWGRSPSDIYAVGDDGVILHWDGGSWARQSAGTQANLHAVGGDARQVLVGGDGVLLRHH